MGLHFYESEKFEDESEFRDYLIKKLTNENFKCIKEKTLKKGRCDIYAERDGFILIIECKHCKYGQLKPKILAQAFKQLIRYRNGLDCLSIIALAIPKRDSSNNSELNYLFDFLIQFKVCVLTKEYKTDYNFKIVSGKDRPIYRYRNFVLGGNVDAITMLSNNYQNKYPPKLKKSSF